ncbi:hypothetical protein E4U53_002211 [Claviceps sorghi]|nr:hypothetical protein E4U53_002211 [Claviceps sorghi]
MAWKGTGLPDVNDLSLGVVCKANKSAYYGHADLVKLLIQHGADLNRPNDKGQSQGTGAVFKKKTP